MRRTRFRLVVAGVCFLGLGCGEAFPESVIDDFDALVTVRGTVDLGGGSVSLRGSRVALLWKTGTSYEVAGDSPVVQKPETQVYEFVVRVERRPPSSATVEFSQAKVAMAGLVLYHDANGNHRLDRLETGGSSGAVDRLLGVGQYHSIWYLFGGRDAAPMPALPEKVERFAVRRFTKRCFATLSCTDGEWMIPELGMFDRPVYSGVTVQLDRHLKEGCETTESIGRYGVCSRIRGDLDDGFRTECPPGLNKCDGNTDGVHPQVVYGVAHQQLIEEALGEGCCPLPLGESPWHCNPALGCPPGYRCVDSRCTNRSGTLDDHKWIFISAGEFDMGAPEDDPCRNVYAGEPSQHKVRLTSPFLMSRSEVTQARFSAVIGMNPSRFSPTGAAASDYCPSCPVESVTWHEAAAYCRELSVTTGAEVCYDCNWTDGDVFCWEAKSFEEENIYKCKGYRLPTEAEWERAYRAGTKTPLYNGPITNCLTQDSMADQIAWYSPKGGPTTYKPQPVMQKLPNGWGLFDMAGNVAEWVQDWEHYYYVGDNVEELNVDPVYFTKDSPISGRMTRGGGYPSLTVDLRASARYQHDPTSREWWVGFRCIKGL